MEQGEVRAEQIRTLYRHGLAVLLAHLVNSWIVAALLWRSASTTLLVTWCGAMALMTLARLILHRRYWQRAPAADEALVWGRRFVLGSFSAGLLWGAAGLVLFGRAGTFAQLILSFVIGGMCAAAAGTLSSYLPAFFAYVVPALLAVTVRAFSIGDALHVAMGAMLLVFGVAMCFVATVNHRSLGEAFRLRFRNEALLAELSAAQTRLEETNRTLEQRVAERTEALRQQSEALRDAQRMEAVGRLAGGVAHDFNNLLMVVLANASDLLKNPRPADEQRVPLSEIRDAATRGAELVKQLLLFSRRQSARPETLDLNRTLTTMQRLLARMLGERVSLSVRAPTSPLFVSIDPTQIEQVLINLVTNARDAMPSGGAIDMATEKLELSEPANGLAPGPYALLSVGDTGSGMDAETRLRIFDPFFTTKQVGQGTGLGLATVYGIVDQGGGRIRVESEPGKGSRFYVYLPLAAPPASLPTCPSRGMDKPATGATNVLLVEDEASVRVVTERMLKKAGHSVITAVNAEQALALADEGSTPFQLLITDVVMPGLSGPELARQLRVRRPELRTLFISGYSRDHVIPESAADQQVAFLAKPFTFEALLEKVSALVADRPGPGARLAAMEELS